MRLGARTTVVADGRAPPPEPRDVLGAFPGPFGLYLHVPFCRSLCPYCPYNKVLLRGGAAAPYFAALREELRLYGAEVLRFESLYVGGGTPSLCVEQLAPLVESLIVEHERAIEVLPTHATTHTLARLRSLGFDYVSLGIQSFDDGMLRHLGRLNTAEENRAALARSVGAFACVNADLIFDVAFAEPQVFLSDFEECCRTGVDQISTYPLMHFGYTPFGKAAHTPRIEHALLRQTCELAERLGYERRSVWTFTRVGGPLYASIARELYLGCGAGAATFTGEDFLVNHFGLARYEQALAVGRLPLARRAHLGALRAALYYAFWQLYAPGIDLVRFRGTFPGAAAVAPLLDVLRRLGYLDLREERLHLTERGFDRYHDLERWVTYHLIEPLWEEMLEEHPPDDLPRRRSGPASDSVRRHSRAPRVRARAAAPHRRSPRLGRRPDASSERRLP